MAALPLSSNFLARAASHGESGVLSVSSTNAFKITVSCLIADRINPCCEDKSESGNGHLVNVIKRFNVHDTDFISSTPV